MNEHHTCKWSSYCPECEVDRLRCEGKLKDAVIEAAENFWSTVNLYPDDGEKFRLASIDYQQAVQDLVSEERDQCPPGQHDREGRVCKTCGYTWLR